MNDFSVNEVDSADILDQLSDPISNNEVKNKMIDDDFSILEKSVEYIISLKSQNFKRYLIQFCAK